MLGGTSALEHLALESVLSAGKGPFNPLLIFYVNQPCIVIGRSQNPWREASPSCVFPVFRRVSGGGAVYHDGGNLNWAYILPRASHDRETELETIAEAIRSQGLPVSTNRRGGIFLGDRKISGSARRFGPERVLHHGTLLVNADLAALRKNLGGIATRDDASPPSEPSPVANLGDFKPGWSISDWAGVIARAAAGTVPAKVEAANLVDADDLSDEMDVLRSDEWIYGRTPAFTIEQAGGSRVPIRVENGRLSSGVDRKKIGRYFNVGEFEKIIFRRGAIPAREEVHA